MLVENKIHVGMAEIHIAQVPTLFTCLGLGSCIGLCVVDPKKLIAGSIHVMLPEAFKNRPIDKVGKFADTGVPELIKMLDEAGADRSRLIAAYSGGASVFQFGTGNPGSQEIGARNALAVKAQVQQFRLKVLGTDVGGTSGRTMTFDSSTGVVKVKTAKAGESVLCVLKG